MYVPPAFAVDHEAALTMVEGVAFGALVVAGADGLAATHLPFAMQREPLRLVGHVAKANPVWRSDAVQGLMIVQGQNAYISPGFYPSKIEHGRVVPTWNYEAVHLHGTLEWFDDRDRLLAVVDGLTRHFETGRDQPWSVADAPTDYVERLLAAIVGVELQVTRVEAAAKLSQNRNAADRAGVIAGLSASSQPGDQAVAKAMNP